MTINLEELRTIAEAATPGPWETLGGQGPFGTHAVCHRMEQGTLVEIAYRDAHFDKANAVHIATFDPPTVLALLSRLEQAERVCVKLKHRLDAMRRQRDGYRNQLRKTEQQVQRVQELAEAWKSRGEHDMEYSKTIPQDVGEIIFEGGAEMVNKANLIFRALDGDTRRLADQGLGGDNDG